MKILLKNRNRQNFILLALIICAILIIIFEAPHNNKDYDEPIYPNLSGTPIYVDDSRTNYNWEKLKSDGRCTGLGTQGNPYVIENEIIDGSGWENGIWVEYSQAYFIIQDCKLTNCGQDWMDGGIKLNSVQNGVITNNNCTGNTGSGIYLQASSFIELNGNEASYNQECGIFLMQSSNNILSNNNVHDNIETRNGRAGIKLYYGRFNQIVENNVSNQWAGIDLSGVSTTPIEFNNVSRNIVSDCVMHGIELNDANNNSISSNTVRSCPYGVFLTDSNTNIIESNLFLKVSTCIRDGEGNVGNVISNNICNPTESEEIISFGFYFLLFMILGLIIITARHALKVRIKELTKLN